MFTWSIKSPLPLGTGVPKSLIIPNPALLSVVPLIKEPMYLPAVAVGATLAKKDHLVQLNMDRLCNLE
jgi:hypothetical protein